MVIVGIAGADGVVPAVPGDGVKISTMGVAEDVGVAVIVASGRVSLQLKKANAARTAIVRMPKPMPASQ